MSLENQRERLKKVLNHLKEQGYLQKDIAAKTGTDTIYISHLKNGKVKIIPDSFLEKLREMFGINPDYIREKSNIMLDIHGTNLEHFEKIVDDWGTVTHGEKHYLHICMDSNFYNFLIDVDTARQAADQGVSSLQSEINALKQLHTGNPVIQEFVLIPRNNFVEIVSDTQKPRKELFEIIDPTAFTDGVD